VVKVNEGEPVRIADINITSDYDLSDIEMFQPGEVFTAKKFIQIKADIVALMLKEGYCSYALDSKAYVDLETHTVDVKFHLKKGDVCTFGNVTVRGLENIDPRIVKSRVRAEKGMRFSIEAVQDTSTAIYGLQSFDSVLINVDRKFYNVVPVDITVQEMKDPYHIEAGAGYDTYVGPRVHVKFIKHNFMGNAQQLSLALSWSSLEQLARIDFFKPVLFDIYGFDTDFGASIGYSNLEYDGFREKKAWTRFFLKHESEKLKIVGGMALEAIEISQLDDGVCVLPCDAYNTFLLAYPYIDVTYDARDSKLNPKYGYYFSAYSEMGLPTDDVSSLYLKTELEARGIYTVSNLTMAIVGKIGAIDLEDSNIGIPESKKFFAGGAYSNRAYGYREIGVIVSPTEDLINGALSMANLSVELDYPIWGDLYGAVFTDNTMLTAESYDYTGDIITSAGAGVRYMTPVGPFKLDVAFNVDDPSIYGISFQIGQSF
jgi:translocation and assembly module TamA